MKGYFISIEGTDGAGKTTQIELLTNYLKQLGKEVILTREPGGTLIGEKIRQILLDSKNSEMYHTTEVLLYAAARAQHVSEKIRPAVKQGKIVISDRFLDSSIAYQGYGRKLDEKIIESINAYAIEGAVPDFTIFLDLPVDIGMKRKQKQQNHKLDRMELENMEFHKRVYEGFQTLCMRYPKRIKRFDASLAPEIVQKQIQNELNTLFFYK